MTNREPHSTRLPGDAILYHYTSLERLESILRAKCFWASHVSYTNDRQEVKHTINRIREELSVQASESTYQKIFPFRQEVEKSLNSILNTDSFVFCLSRDGDLLSQWRAYCPPDGGYSVGFLASDLVKCVETQGFDLVECIYSPPAQRSLLDSALLRLISDLDTAGNDDIQKQLALHYFEGYIAAISAICKHPSFAEENEWRIISQRKLRKPEYRLARNLAVPFVSVKIELNGSMPVNRIIVGPNKHQELAIKGLKHLLRALGVSEDTVTASGIPYRTL